MRVVFSAATIGEWMPAFLEIDTLYTSESKRMKVIFHQGGVGLLANSVALMRMAYDEKPDLVVQVGIAGCFDPSVPLGNIFAVKDDLPGDIGVEEDGKWKDIFDLKLEKPGYPPFEKKRLPNQHIDQYNLLQLPLATAVTVNEISTRQDRIQQLKKKYDPLLETMEGAALHYVCRELNIPFLQIRSVSNYVGERDKTKWQLQEAISNLNQTILKYVEQLYIIK